MSELQSCTITRYNRTIRWLKRTTVIAIINPTPNRSGERAEERTFVRNQICFMQRVIQHTVDVRLINVACALDLYLSDGSLVMNVDMRDLDII